MTLLPRSNSLIKIRIQVAVAVLALAASTTFAQQNAVLLKTEIWKGAVPSLKAAGPLEVAFTDRSFFAKNLKPFSVSAFFQCSGGKLMAFTVPPLKIVKATSEVPFNACSIFGGGFVGALNAKESEGAKYRLPYPDGQSFCIGQAPGAKLTTHLGAAQYAVDILLNTGDTIVAAREGLVATILTDNPNQEGVPNEVRIEHKDGTVGTYAHIQRATVKVGDAVKAGQIIAYAGSSGSPAGPHLHFDVRVPDLSASYVTLPFKFYVGSPNIFFEPREGYKVTATSGNVSINQIKPSQDCLASRYFNKK